MRLNFLSAVAAHKGKIMSQRTNDELQAMSVLSGMFGRRDIFADSTVGGFIKVNLLIERTRGFVHTVSLDSFDQVTNEIVHVDSLTPDKFVVFKVSVLRYQRAEIKHDVIGIAGTVELSDNFYIGVRGANRESVTLNMTGGMLHKITTVTDAQRTGAMVAIERLLSRAVAFNKPVDERQGIANAGTSIATTTAYGSWLNQSNRKDKSMRDHAKWVSSSAAFAEKVEREAREIGEIVITKENNGRSPRK